MVKYCQSSGTVDGQEASMASKTLHSRMNSVTSSADDSLDGRSRSRLARVRRAGIKTMYWVNLVFTVCIFSISLGLYPELLLESMTSIGIDLWTRSSICSNSVRFYQL